MNQQRFARALAYVLLLPVCGFEYSGIRFLVITAFSMLHLNLHGHVGSIISLIIQRRRPWAMVRDSSPNFQNQLVTSSLSPAPQWWKGVVNVISKLYRRFNRRGVFFYNSLSLKHSVMAAQMRPRVHASRAQPNPSLFQLAFVQESLTSTYVVISVLVGNVRRN